MSKVLNIFYQDEDHKLQLAMLLIELITKNSYKAYKIENGYMCSTMRWIYQVKAH